LIALRHIVPLLWIVCAASCLPSSASADDKGAPGVIQDPHYGEVLFYFYQEDYFPAIVRLLAAQRQQLQQHHEAEAELLLGGLYLSYGNHMRAAGIFDRLLAASADPVIRDRTWFFLAKIWQQRAYLVEAQNALDQIGSALPRDLEVERQMMQAQLYIDRGEYDRAIALLRDWQGESEWASYARFNLGVALARSGQVDSATRILDELGGMPTYNEELNSLRDKANLALGYAYLQDGQSRAARSPLQRVRLEGPFSNKALLGIGWAYAESDNYRRALVPWMELRSRNLLDPAVQESMLAIPFAMAKLESISQAADHYLNAVEAFYEEATRIENAIALIESGTLFEHFLVEETPRTTGWYWKLDDVPAAMESRYLYHLLASHEFQEGLKNYRDLTYLEGNLDEWQESIEVYRNMLDTRQLAYEQRTPQVSASLSGMDLEGMVDRKLQFDERLNSIEKASDSLALATDHEFALWGEVSALEQNPALQADLPEAAEVRDKIRLLKGVLQWKLDAEFKVRLANIRKDLRGTGAALVETQRSRRKIDEAMRQEPLNFASYSARVAGLGPRIDDLRQRVDVAKDRQRAFLQLRAVDELRAQQQRLETYTVQARFALAAIYDLSSTTVGDASQ
jgi:Tfp pilus assembly protein PilF